MPLDLKNPGGKEYVVVGGGALLLALIYFMLHKSKNAGNPSPAGTPPPAPGPGNQAFLPGQQSQTGNPFLDTLFTTPMQPPPGTGIMGGPPVTSFPKPPPRIMLPVRHPRQGAESILGPISSGAPAGAAVGTTVSSSTLTGSWRGSSLFTSPVSPLAWANSILTTGHFPKTPANQQSLIAWALNEGGGGSYNPLNTTMGSQYPAFNSVGVRNFPNWNVGASETVATINNGRYPNIQAGLQSGKGIGGNAAPDLLTWSGSGYSGISSNWAQAGKILAADVKAAQAAAAKRQAAKATRAASATKVRSLFPIVRPRSRPVSYNVPKLNYAFLARIFPVRTRSRRGPQTSRYAGSRYVAR